MKPRDLNWIAESCGGRLLNAAPSLVVRRLSTDSRDIQAGDLFVALPGERFDGHDFVADVLARGAVAAVVEENRVPSLPSGLPCVLVTGTRHALGQIAARHRREFDLSAVAVAGSNGKTSTKELIASVLGQRLETVASAASFNNDIGVPLTLLRIETKHKAGVFEVGTNHPGELRPLLEMIQPTAGVITSIGREHLEFFGTLDGVLEEEGTLAEVLPPSGFLVINGGDHGAEDLARRTRARVIRVGFGKENEWRIGPVEMNADGSRFHVQTADPEYSGEYSMKLLGSHQVVNATYAIVVGKELGLGRAEIQRGLASCAGAKRRLQLRRIDAFLVLDDAYNANADSMAAALGTLGQFPCQGRRIAVLGEMAELGASSIAAHEEVGRRAAENQVDCLVAVGGNSRLMAEAARAAGLREVTEIQEVESAGPAVIRLVRPGDVILVKASRAARLERVIDFLAARFGAKEAEAA